MVARNALLMLLVAAASGRLRADTVQCGLEAEVTYPTGGGAPVPVCSSKCACSESTLWCQGTAYHRIPELTANYQSMVKAVYQYGALTSCTLVPYQTTEQLAAQAAVYQKNFEFCNASAMAAAAEATTAAIVVETTTVVTTTTTTTTTTAIKPTTTPTTTEETTTLPNTTTSTTTETTPTTTTSAKPTTTTTTTTHKPTTTTKQAPVYSCPTGYKMYSTTKCYKVVPNAVTWTAARDICFAEGGYLATIGSAAENAFLASLMTNTIWFGLNDLGSDYFLQYANGSPVNYTNFNPGEPNNHQSMEHCIELQYGIFKWNDTQCTLERHYACEKSVTVT